MDSLHFSASSDESAPRTPSPPSMPMRYSTSPQNYKAELDPVRIFSADDDSFHWGSPHQQAQPFPAPSRPSLLQELYESDSPEHASPPDMYVEQQDAAAPQWATPVSPPQGRPQDYTMIRRATFPYARQERPEDLQYPPFLHHEHAHHSQHAQYPDAHHMPLSAEPSALHGHGHGHHGDGGYSPPHGYAPPDAYDPAVKLEQHHHGMYHHGPPPPQFYHRHPSHSSHPHPSSLPHPSHAHPHHMPQHHMHPYQLPGGYAPHGLPVQHTDDAASKETQYLRRRCYNCHTTEPPSWRRSTLNPGKIVCNKCGLYERTHLRARPLRFDELRAGNKARGGKGKVAKGAAGAAAGGVKKGVVARRSSVSSNGSSAQSGGSDWDDSVSVYSNGSAPPTSYNSPMPPSQAYSPHPPALALSSHSPHSNNSHSHSGSSNNSNSPGRDAHSCSPPLPGSAGFGGFGSPSLSSSASPSFAASSPAYLQRDEYRDGSPSFASSSPSYLQRSNGGGGEGIRLPHAPDMPTLMRTKPRSNTTGGLSSGSGGGLYYSPPSHGHGLHHSSSNSSLHSLGSSHGGGSAGWDDLVGGGGGAMVKEEPRAVVV
ncbi:hypothetical protein DFH06DRAFT_1119418 [Mycena polygramma]|nr:hypothetical protein DFH06DRAFT_1119418 [Mycena polygramma]